MNNETPKFRKVEPQQNKNSFRRKIGMVQSFAMALASRGIKGKKINTATKQLRVLSCFGNDSSGGVLPPCEHLGDSKEKEGMHFCEACGCGDRAGTWLIAESTEYGKLDYPKLACPLSMPGFTNYMPSKEDESVDPITRKYYIENIDYVDLQKVSVNIAEMPEKLRQAMESSKNMKKHLNK